MPKLEKYYREVSPIILSYDWNDVIKGVGYIDYYLTISVDSGGNKYNIVPNVMDSGYNYIPLTAVPTDLDFDLDFAKDAYIKGKFLFNFTQRPGSGGAAGSCSTRINIYHVDTSANETLLGTNITANRSGSGTYYRENIEIDVSLKRFGDGDTLRFNIVALGSANLGALYLDPASGITFTDVLGRTIGTDFPIKIPFEVEE